ncbi:MAG: chain-length determining protein [Muribaculaceae bacterium]|nr:chain-length determining protein [Muribaculaceae bacterium]
MAPDTDEKEIDLLELAGKLWDNRKKIIKWGICGAIIGLIVAFSIPKEFITTTKLSPEITDSKQASGGLSALASMAGFGGGSAGGADAVYPQLYPDVVSSVPFLTGLFDVEVETKDDGEKFTVQQFIEDETSGPWWGFILGIPGKILGLLKSSEKVEEGHVLNNFQLTMDEDILVKALAQRVTASVDQKTSVVTISVQMQDPLVSAILADTVVSRLQNYITDYRTNKARKDLEYAEKLNSEAQQEYYRAQQTLADYTDRNQGLATQSARITRDRLENEAQLAFSLYNQTAQQVQKAKAKVQENTPVYAVVVPPTVPVKAASPRKPLILVGFTFLAVVACSGWILFLQPLIEERKRNLTNTSSNGADAGKA